MQILPLIIGPIVAFALGFCIYFLTTDRASNRVTENDEPTLFV